MLKSISQANKSIIKEDNMRKILASALVASSLLIAGCGSEEKPEDAAEGINQANHNELSEQLKTYQNHTNNQIEKMKNDLEKQIKQVNDQLPVLNNQVQQQLQAHNGQVQEQIQKAYNDLQGQIKQLHGEVNQLKGAR